jgi:hypothetical protein
VCTLRGPIISFNISDQLAFDQLASVISWISGVSLVPLFLAL